jgi:hypothetical protein
LGTLWEANPCARWLAIIEQAIEKIAARDSSLTHGRVNALVLAASIDGRGRQEWSCRAGSTRGRYTLRQGIRVLDRWPPK